LLVVYDDMNQMAVTIHKYVTEDKEPEAIAIMQALGDALKAVYSPPRLLELPHTVPVSALAAFADAVTSEQAVYLRYDSTTASALSATATTAGGTVAGFARTVYPEVYTVLGYKLQQSSSTTAATAAAAVAVAAGAMEGGGGDKWEKAAVDRALAAQTAALPLLLPQLQQQHVQAIVEAYQAGRSGGLLNGSSDTELAAAAAVMSAVDAAAALSFAADPVYSTVRQLEAAISAAAEGDSAAAEQLEAFYYSERFAVSTVFRVW
jgi:hypothetical protein